MSTLNKVGHLVKLLEQHGFGDNPDPWKELFETPALALILRVAATDRSSGKSGQLRAVDYKALRRILGLPEEEFDIFCDPKVMPWFVAGKLLGSEHPFLRQADEVCDNGPRGRFKGEIIELTGVPSLWHQEFAARGLVSSTLLQLLCFSFQNISHLKHKANLVGFGK